VWFGDISFSHFDGGKKIEKKRTAYNCIKTMEIKKIFLKDH